MATKEEITEFFATTFPQSDIVIDHVGDGTCRVIKPIGERQLRPGGTVSGPTMMALADTALYVAIFGAIGIVPLAVTTNLNTNFLRKPQAGKDLIAECELIKVGKRLAVGEVAIFSEGDPKMVAHAVGTYSIPENR